MLQVSNGAWAAVAPGMGGIEQRTASAAPADCAAPNAYMLAGPSGATEGTSVQQVALATGKRSEIGNFTVPRGVAVNGLDVAPGGRFAWAVSEDEGANSGTQTVFRLDLSSNTTTSFPGATKEGAHPRQTVRGAINPVNGWFYYSHAVDNAADQGRPTTQVIYAFDTVKNVNVGPVGTLTDPRFNGDSGDLVFDSAGNLYIVISTPQNLASGGLNAALVGINETLPTTAENKALTADLIAKLPDGAHYGSALGADGFLYTTRARVTPAGELFKINPNSGEIVSTMSMTVPPDKDPTPVDAGNCSYGPNFTSQANIAGRFAPNDQFTVSITGNGIASGNTGTSTGTDTGDQNTPPETAGPLPGVVGKTYTFTETAASDGDLSNYTTTYRCVDTAHDNALLTSGEGTTFDYTVPSSKDAHGVAVLCTFANTPKPVPKSTLTVNKIAQVTDTSEGRQVTYTLKVTNTSDVPATGVRTVDNLTDVIDNARYNNDARATSGTVTYEAPNVIWTGDLAPGQTATVTYSVTVEPDDKLANTVTVTAPNSNCPGSPECTDSTATPIEDTDPGRD